MKLSGTQMKKIKTVIRRSKFRGFYINFDANGVYCEASKGLVVVSSSMDLQAFGKELERLELQVSKIVGRDCIGGGTSIAGIRIDWQ